VGSGQWQCRTKGQSNGRKKSHQNDLSLGSEAILRNAKVTDEQVAQAKSLNGATMPDGTTHE
jgi:hypothetical protein